MQAERLQVRAPGQQVGQGQPGAGRVRPAAAGPVRRGAVRGLEQRRGAVPEPPVGVDRRRSAQRGRARPGADHVGEDVTEDPLGDDHRGQVGPGDQFVGGPVDVDVGERHPGRLRRGARDAPPQPGGREHARLVHADRAPLRAAPGVADGDVEHLPHPGGLEHQPVLGGAVALALGMPVRARVRAAGDVADDRHVLFARHAHRAHADPQVEQVPQARSARPRGGGTARP